MSNSMADRIGRLRLDLGITDRDALELLVFGLEDAARYHRQVSDIHAPGITFKAMREAVASLQGALTKIANGKASPMALSQVRKFLTTAPPKQLQWVDVAASQPYGSFAPRVAALVEHPDAGAANELLEYLAAFRDAMATPGPGGARKQARRYLMGIQKLAQHFQEALPAHKVSANENSIFYRYAAHWLKHYAMLDASPERHISNALEDISHWGKVSL